MKPTQVMFFIIISFTCLISQKSQNIFDNLPALAAPKIVEILDELDHYLSTPPEQTDDVMVTALLPEVDGDGSDYEMEDGWDVIATQASLS